MKVGLEENRNAWRQRVDREMPWSERLKAGAPDKYFIVTCDSHANEPFDLWEGRIDDPDHRARLPHVETRDDGTQWIITDGWEPQLISIPGDRKDLLPEQEDFENYEVLSPFTDKMDREDTLRAASGRSIEQRLEHARRDGVDAEIIFPQKGLLAFATPDNDLAGAMTRAWNRWALEYFGGHFDRMLPMALIAPGNVEDAIKEVHWAAGHGFHGIEMPCRPIFNRAHEPRSAIHYNHRMFEPLWSAVEETGLPVTFHVATGEDPRAHKGGGAALVAFQASQSVAIEPVITMISGGVFERHKRLKIATIETNVGWIPWVLNSLDHAYKAHHMWARPSLPRKPSEYFAEHCHATLLEDSDMLDVVVGMGFEDNILWSNDYPHHEGSFPHSSCNIQRQMGNLTETQRAKILGENARRLFRIG